MMIWDTGASRGVPGVHRHPFFVIQSITKATLSLQNTQVSKESYKT